MMKGLKKMLFAGGLACVVSGVGAAESAALLYIAGKPVSKEAFEYYCRTHPNAGGHGGSVDRYLRSFLSRQLKVADAGRKGWDTLPDFRQQCKVMQGEALKSYLLDKSRTETLCRQIYRQGVERFASKGWVRIDEIVIPLSPCASNSDVECTRVRLDSIYHALQQGASFQSYSRHPFASVPWCPVVSLLREVAEQLKGLDKGAYSRPFFSPKGGHIVQLVDSRPELSYEEARPYILAYLDRLGKDSPVLRSELYTQWENGTLGSKEDVQICLDAVRENLLASYWDHLHATSSSVQPASEELERYFESNRRNYDWEYPHYKGAVIHCQNKKMASRIRKRLKKLSPDLWENALHRLMEEDTTVCARIEVGLFQIGTNPYVDKLAFRCGKLPADAEYPYSFILGKRLKKGPENYRDVLSEVEKDYCLEQEARSMKALEQQFGVEINQEVLKSVNCNGSN